MNVKALRKFPEFVEFAGKSADVPGEDGATTVPLEMALTETTDTPEESLDRNFRIHRDALAAELLESVRNGSPTAFEKAQSALFADCPNPARALANCRNVGQLSDARLPCAQDL